MPVLCNLFGTPEQYIMTYETEDDWCIIDVGKLLAFLKEPEYMV